jgi:pilus assembly protein CpaF
VTPQAGLLLKLAVEAKAPLLVTGATGAGKTEMINVVADCFAQPDAVVVIEDTRELNIPVDNVSYLMTRLASAEGEGEIRAQSLVQQSLRKRPDWIVLGEARGEEAWDFVQAGNTGHATIGSVHANSARDAVERFRDLCLGFSENLRENVVMRGVLRAFRLVIYLERDARSGRRVIKSITEVTGRIEDTGVPVLKDLFRWEDGALRCTGYDPDPLLASHLERVGGYGQVKQGSGIPQAWLDAARSWLS